MRTAKAPSGLRAFRLLGMMLLLVPLLSACAGGMEASRSTVFGPSSEKAIVVVGTSVNMAQEEEIRAGRSLATYWQEYDPERGRLMRDGRTFLTKVHASLLSEPEYTTPTVSVLEVDAGNYALIAAGFPHLMSLYVSPHYRKGRYSTDDPSRIEIWSHSIDPRSYVNPIAEVDSRRNFLFSVAPGQIVYIGHFQFMKRKHSDSLVSIAYSQDAAAAREALAAFPGISGVMVTFDPAQPPQSVAR